MAFDRKGNLYLGDFHDYSIVRPDPQCEVTVVLGDEPLIWPDSYSVSGDDYLYISCSQIQPDYKEGEDRRSGPYTLYRMKLI
jgi:sugar lactone lactonase YvrE